MFSNLSLVGLSVSLYFYDLRSLLGDDENVSLKNLKNFCRKLYGDTIEQELDEICRRDNPHTNYVNILGDSQKVRILNPILGIDTYPVQMGDVYGCIIEVLGERALRNTARNLNEIHIAKQQIDSLSLSEATVGQTWVVMGKLLDGQDVELTVDTCCEQLGLKSSPHWDYYIKNKSEIYGADLFDIWIPDVNSQAKIYHLVLCLFPSTIDVSEMRSRKGKLYLDFLQLFRFRHKLIKSYKRSHTLRSRLQEDFGEIREIAQTAAFQSRLNNDSPILENLEQQLGRSIEVLSRYSPNLTDLYYQGRTIDINEINYEKRQERIVQMRSGTNFLLNPESEFLNVIKKNRRDVSHDYDRFAQGLTLLESLIEAIQGRTSLYQARLGRSAEVRGERFNQTVAMLGIGLATSQIASAVIIAQEPPASGEDFFRTQAFWQSILAGSVAALFVYSILRLLTIRSRN